MSEQAHDGAPQPAAPTDTSAQSAPEASPAAASSPSSPSSSSSPATPAAPAEDDGGMGGVAQAFASEAARVAELRKAWADAHPGETLSPAEEMAFLERALEEDIAKNAAAPATASPAHVAAAELPPGGTPPAAPDPAAPKKLPLEEWARLKGVHTHVPKQVKNRKTGKVTTKIVRSKNDESHFYAGLLAKWSWVPTTEVTEAEFDEAFMNAKHGVVMGHWPHPQGIATKVAATLALLASLGHGPGKTGEALAALPDVVTTIVDGGLGIVAASSANASALIGSCSGGTVNTVYGFNDPDTLTKTLVSGPAVELAAYMLSQPGHGTVYVVPCTCATAGACGSRTYTRVGSSTGTIGAAGAAFDAYSFVITITQGEASVAGGGGTFTWSADAGNTTSQVIAIPTGGTYVVPGTNVTLTFTGSSTAFDTGDVITFSCTAPYYSGSDFTTAFNALKANPATWRFVAAVGAASSATNAATFASTLQSLMSALEGANRDAPAFVQCNDTDANCQTSFAAFAGNRVSVVGGQEWLTSTITGRVSTRDALWPVVGRIATRPVSEDAGRVATGPLIGITKLLRDEEATPALDAARFITLRTIVGLQGYYITDGWTMAVTGSDFALLQNRFVMDVACTAARAAELKFLNDTVRVNPAGVSAPLVAGGIFPLDAIRIQAAVKRAVRIALKIGQSNGKMPAGDASDASVIVNQAVDIIGAQEIPITVRVVPMGYGKMIDNNIGLDNPATQLAA